MVMYGCIADRQFEACPGMHDEDMFMTHVFPDFIGSARPQATIVVERRIWSMDHAFGSSATGVGSDKLIKSGRITVQHGNVIKAGW